MLDHDPSGIELARLIFPQRPGGAPAPKPRRPSTCQAGQLRQPRRPAGPRRSLDDLTPTRWSTEVNLHHLLGRWPDLVGPANAEHANPEGFEQKVLHVRADSTAWATNLRRWRRVDRGPLVEQLGEGTVLRIVVKGPDAPSWKHGRRSV